MNIANISVKICSKCGEEKNIDNFYKDKSRKDGLSNKCKFCVKEYSKQFHLLHLEKNKQNKKEYYLKNRNRILKNVKKYNLQHRKERKQYIKEYCLKNPNYYKGYYQKNKHKIIQNKIKYALENRSKINKRRRQKYKTDINYKKKIQEHTRQNYAKHKEKRKQYRLNHLEKYKQYKINNREKNLKQIKHRRKIDINYKILTNYRARIIRAIKSNATSGHTICLIMCSIPQLKQYIEKQWQTGMNWNNWGKGNEKWNIDHIIPCSFFNMSDPVEQHMCFRYQNLQPLWWKDNMTKGSKVNL